MSPQKLPNKSPTESRFKGLLHCPVKNCRRILERDNKYCKMHEVDGTGPRHGNPNWTAADVTKEWLVVECARLESHLQEKIGQVQRLQVANDELQTELTRARSGLEFADLIKKMVNS